MPQVVFDTPKTAAEMKAHLRRLMKTVGMRFHVKPDSKNVTIIDYYDGTVDAIVEETWCGEDGSAVHDVESALCPITLEDVKEIKPLWHNVFPVYRQKHYKAFNLKVEKFPLKINRFIGGLLRRNS